MSITSTARRFLPALLSLAAWLFTTPVASAATEFGKAFTEVIQALSMQKMNDLDFGRSEAPSPAVTIDPASGAGKAQFLVRGQPQTLYHVKLPSSISLRMVGGNGAGNPIVVRNFRAFPPDGNTILDASGRQILSIGATREAVSQTQTPGKYEGVFTVTVCYNC